MKRFSFIALVFAALFSLWLQPADAAFLAGGNTFPSTPPLESPGVDGHVNFAVFTNTGGADPFGLGDAAFYAAAPWLDTTAAYLYLYQTVNDGGNPSAITSNTVDVVTAFVTSFGSAPGVGFNLTPPVDGIETLTSPGGPWVGIGTAAPADPSPMFPALTPVGTAPDGSVIAPGGVGLSPPDTILAVFFPAPLAAGSQSAVWGYTSNRGPIVSSTLLVDGVSSAQGTVLVAGLPEPASLAVWAGLLSVAGFIGIRSRRGKRSA
jgi:hypothetical protein